MDRLIVAIVATASLSACITFDTTRDASAVTLEVPNPDATLVLGAVCSASHECVSGFCSDGVCCNERCGDSCARCDGDGAGTCHAVVSAPTGSHAACATNKDACAGRCD